MKTQTVSFQGPLSKWWQVSQDWNLRLSCLHLSLWPWPGFTFTVRLQVLVQFCSVQDGIYGLRKAHRHSTPSLRNFPITFGTVPMSIRLTMAHSHPFKEDHLALPPSTPLSSRWSTVWCPWLSAFRQRLKLLITSSFHASLLQVIDGVMSLAFCLQAASQAPQHFRFLKKRATCEGCFADQCICSVISPSLQHVPEKCSSVCCMEQTMHGMLWYACRVDQQLWPDPSAGRFSFSNIVSVSHDGKRTWSWNYARSYRFHRPGLVSLLERLE